ncbi:MAG: DUF6456 domain-containing protein [Rhodoblastus sp.]
MSSNKRNARSGVRGKAGGRSADAAADAGRNLGRDARRLLLALAKEGAGPARADLCENFLVVAAPRAGVTAIIAKTPAGAGDELQARGLARWTAHAPARLELTGEGANLARRLAAPAGVAPFRAQHGEFVQRALESGACAVAVDAAESPLTWLARRKGRDGAPFLAPAQIEAGERFRRDVEIAQLRQRVTSDWSGAAGAGQRGPQNMQMSDVLVAARQRLDRAAQALGGELAGVLFDVCGMQKGLELVERERAWPPRSGKIALRIALDRLAAHYGLGSLARGPERGRLVNWGASDYRPNV